MNNNDINTIHDFEMARVKSIQSSSLFSLIFSLTLFLVPISLIIDLVNGLRILATNWNNKHVNHDKITWGILTLLLPFGSIWSLIFSSNAKKQLKQQVNVNY